MLASTDDVQSSNILLTLQEDDVRYVGHWGNFLNASLRKADRSNGHDMLSVLDKDHMINVTRNIAATLPGRHADLIVYSRLLFGDKWRDTRTNLDLPGSWDSFAQVRTASGPMLQLLLTSSAFTFVLQCMPFLVALSST